MAWIAGQEFINPADQTLLADTGALSGGAFLDLLVAVRATTGLEVLLQHRDASNLSTLRSFIIPCTLSLTLFRPPRRSLIVAPGERYRVMQLGSVTTGNVQVSLFYNPDAWP